MEEKNTHMDIHPVTYRIPCHHTTWRIEELTGYKPMTTFYEDFSIADRFGEIAVISTYKNAMRCWKSDYKYLTELVMVLNWKSWEHYEKGNTILCQTYTNMYYEARDYALDNLKGDEFAYFYRTTD